MTINDLTVDHAGDDAREEPIGLDRLDEVELSEAHRLIYERAAGAAIGPAHWRQRKEVAVRSALALMQIAPRGRLRLLSLGMTEDVELTLIMNVTVPCRGPDGKFFVADHAVLAVRYPQQIMTEDVPGMMLVQIRDPRSVFHANVEPESGLLCLGLKLPRNIPLTEILWMSYAALAMTVHNYDIRDEHGVMNVDAARWWTQHQDRLPLTRTALLEDAPVIATGGEGDRP